MSPEKDIYDISDVIKGSFMATASVVLEGIVAELTHVV